MTIVLAGVGADSDNIKPAPKVGEDGRFEYIPIPEKTRKTTETRTYGNLEPRYRGGVLADSLEEVYPQEDDGPTISGEELREWPVHYDPNFEDATYGERRDRYRKHLRELEQGDSVVFYTGLRPDFGDSDNLYRHLIGYLNISSVVDVENATLAEQKSLLEENSANAHSKRYAATGEVEKDLVIVNGDGSGQLFNYAIRISELRDNGHYYMKEDLVDALNIEDEEIWLGGHKPPITLDTDIDQFLEAVNSL